MAARATKKCVLANKPIDSVHTNRVADQICIHICTLRILEKYRSSFCSGQKSENEISLYCIYIVY